MSCRQEDGALREEILRLKKEKNALILAHYYENLEIQQIADGFGDSFELAKKAKAAENPLVVFCGVRSKIEDQYVPKAFRGLPIQLMAASILALALFAF